MLALASAISTLSLHAQFFDESVNRDSLFQALIKRLPEQRRAGVQDEYNAASKEEKEMVLLRLYMIRSSKKKLIENIDTNFDRIERLKSEYARLVPANFKVRIAFSPADPLVRSPESIRMDVELHKGDRVYYYNSARVGLDTLHWQLTPEEKKQMARDSLLARRMRWRSTPMDSLLDLLAWNEKTLSTVKLLLRDAHCLSIENGSPGEPATIVFSPSGVGVYSYKIFDCDLTPAQIKGYNDGCRDIYYKKNLVLEYTVGAIGSPCFPD
jgi:hypothetical protein